MRKLYVPIMMDPEHRFEQYDADFKNLGADFVFLVESTRFVHLSGQRYERAMEIAKNTIQKYEAHGYECGVWISTLGYGGPLFASAVGNHRFTSIRSLTGGECEDAICPTDQMLVSRVCQVICDLAKAGAKMIMLDDDLCLSVRPGLGCACDTHLAEFARRTGKDTTLNDLPKLLFTEQTNELRKEWLKMQGDTLRDFCRALRSALDKVAPKTRLGFCAGYTSWDVEGVDAIELSRILAGNTKPFLRFTSAPYWLHLHRFGQMTLATYIEFARMQAAWTKNTDVEVFIECDTYPHDRYHTPVSHIECFDVATMLTKNVGVLKYFYHYPCKPETERGYINAHLNAKQNYEALQNIFYNKTEIGVRVYEQMRKLADATLPQNFNQGKIMEKYAFSEAQKMLSVNAIPTVYEGDGLCGIAFGENAAYLEENAFKNGLILDVSAAELIQEKYGIDVGLKACKPLDITPLEDFGVGTPVSLYWATDLCEIEIAQTAQVISQFVDIDFLNEGPRKRVPAAYLYENAKGMRFLVYAFRADNQPDNSGMYWNYRRGEQIANSIAWLSGTPLPVTCNGAPYGYCRCNARDNKIAVAYFNCGPDCIDTLDFHFDGRIKSFRIIGGNGDQTDDHTVSVHSIHGFGYVAIDAEIADVNDS